MIFFFNFGYFSTFLHQFKKNLARKLKIKQCYGISWLFLFKMSHHTFLSVKYSRRLSTFSPAQSSFGLSLGNAGSDAGRSGLFSETFLYQVSSVTEVFYVVVTMYNTYPFPLLITCQILGSNTIIECKSEKNQYCRPSPHPPSTSFGRPSL